MKRHALNSTIYALLLSALVLTAIPLRADEKTAPAPVAQADLSGAWTLVSVDNILADGARIQPYGPSPAGLLLFASDGHYSIHIFRPDRKPFAAKDKSKGTPEEYQAAVQGSNTHFGTYAVDRAAHEIAFRIERALFPNWEGTEQRRSYELVGDRLRYTVRTTTTGGSEVGEVTWRRLR